MNNPISNVLNDLYTAKAVIEEINAIYEVLKEEDEHCGLNHDEMIEYRLVKHLIRKYEEV